jgi:Collagen triple helix repeat (20 copies)
MFSLLRNRFGVPGVIAMIALVFAMLGGAYAATQPARQYKKKGYVITKLNQIKPSVQKQLKGEAGPPGPVGPAGSGGVAGKEGQRGERGEAGQNGTDGEDGEDGEDGVCSVSQPECILPPEATETGSWFGRGGTFGEGLEAYFPISFPIPLTAGLDSNHVHYIAPNGKENNPGGEPVITPIDCGSGIEPGVNAANPQANPGHLCVYAAKQNNATTVNLAFRDPATATSINGSSANGTLLEIITEGSSSYAYGTWAVTAP